MSFAVPQTITTTVTFVWWTLHIIKVPNLGDVSKKHGECFNSGHSHYGNKVSGMLGLCYDRILCMGHEYVQRG